jgi:hypothetical protein
MRRMLTCRHILGKRGGEVEIFDFKAGFVAEE